MRTGVQTALIRHRNWVVMTVLVVVAIILVLVAGKNHGKASVNAPRVRFGALVHPTKGNITVTNGWQVSSGRQQVAVYAGDQPHHPRNGMLIVIVNVSGLPRRDAAILMSGTGALTLLRPPHVNDVLAAGRATVRYLTANGNTGSFNLEADAR
jgi:hypothetical protein